MAEKDQQIEITMEITPQEEVRGLLQEERVRDPLLVVYPAFSVTATPSGRPYSIISVGPPGKKIITEISWKTKEDIDGSRAGIGFYLVAQGDERQTPRGEALVSLEELVTSGEQKIPVRVNIVDVAPDTPEHRLTIDVLVTQFSGKLKKGVESDVTFPPLKTESERGKELIEEFFSFYETHRAKVRAAWNMHIPRFTVGFGSMPAAIFSCVRSEGKMTTQFAKKILGAAADLNGWTLGDVEDQLRKQIKSTRGGEYYWETNMVARIIGEATTMTANCMEYSSDTAGKKDVERFKFVRMNFYSGDCEDVAKESIEVAESLRSDFIGQEGLLGLVSNFLSRYMIVMVTSLATAPSARESKKENNICHIYAMALPRTYYLKLSENEKISREIMEKETPFSIWEEALPVLVLEGTNWCNPLLLPSPLYAPPEHRKDLINLLRKQQEKMKTLEEAYPILKSFSTQIQQRNVLATDPTNLSQKDFTFFYRDVVDMWIADARRYGVNALDFSVGYSTASGHEYGVNFVDLVTKTTKNYEGERIELKPTYKFDEKDSKAMARMTEYLPPFTQWTSGGHAKASTKFPDNPVSLATAKSPYIPNFLVYRTTKLDDEAEKSLEEIKERVEVKTHKFAEDGKLNLTTIKVHLP